VAVKVTGVPAHTGFADAATDTLTCFSGFTVRMMVFEVAGLLTGRQITAWSALYGALAVVIPGALFARGLTSQFSSINAATAGFGFFVWEAMKISVSVGMLMLAPRLVEGLDWLAMLIGLIATIKVYWLALLMRPKRKTV